MLRWCWKSVVGVAQPLCCCQCLLGVIDLLPLVSSELFDAFSCLAWPNSCPILVLSWTIRVWRGTWLTGTLLGWSVPMPWLTLEIGPGGSWPWLVSESYYCAVIDTLPWSLTLSCQLISTYPSSGCTHLGLAICSWSSRWWKSPELTSWKGFNRTLNNLELLPQLVRLHL